MILEFKTKNQKQILASQYWIDSVTEQLLYGGAKGGGKSYLGASLIFGDALIYAGTHYFIARQALTDLRKFTIPTIHEVFKNWGLKFDEHASFDGQYNVFNLHNGSKVFLIECKELPSDPLFERFGSMQMTRGWIEEGGEVSEAAKSNLWLSIGRWKNKEFGLKKKLLVTANPKKGWMKRDFVDLAKENKLPIEKRFVQAFATDNKYLPDDYLNTLSSEKNTVTRQRLWLGDWDYDEDKNSLISFDALTDTFSNTIVKDNQKYMTVDVARLGKDSTVISLWDGLELYKVEKFQRQDTEETKKKVKDIASAHKIPFSNIMVDEDGIGGSVVDGLFGVKGFIANSTPLPTITEVRAREIQVNKEFVPKNNFRNLKSQCAYKLAWLVNEHKIAFNVPELRDEIIEELTEILKKKNIDSEGKLQIVPKDEVKEAIGHSPDIGDSILFRAWFEVKKDAVGDNVDNGRAVQEQKILFMRNKHNLANASTR